MTLQGYTEPTTNAIKVLKLNLSDITIAIHFDFYYTSFCEIDVPGDGET